MEETRRVRLAASQLMTLRTSLEDDVVAVRQAGYDGIGLLRDKLHECGTEKAAEMLAEFQLSVSSLNWAGGFTGDEVLSWEGCIQDALHAVDEAAQVKAGCLIVHSGARAGHTRPHSWRLFRHALDRLLPHAERQGVVLGLEPMHPRAGQRWSIADSIPELLECVERFHSPHLKLVFDSYHLCHDQAWPAWLEQNRERIALIHLADANEPPSDEQNRCLLGTGNLPLACFMHKLAEIGYEGFVEVELFGRSLEGEPFSEILSHSRSAVRQLLGE